MKILILGASVRAAAFSALRAGCVPLAADLFADLDLTKIAPTARIPFENYPDGLFETDLIDQAEAWMFTGALENSPERVERLASRLPVMGNSGPCLRAVRDPFELRDALAREGFFVPCLRRDPRSIGDDGQWLVKPFHSGGGRGVDLWRGGEFSESVYFQRRVEGKSLSAVFIGDERGATLRGISEQSVGAPGQPFGYRGSLGPWPVTPQARSRIAKLGDCVGARFRLRGLFGIDFLLRDDEPWAVEVNPRYTASVEVLELAHRSSILAEHISMFSCQASVAFREHTAGRFVGKEVLFADAPVRYDDGDAEPLAIPSGFDLPILADIPRSGTGFEAGDPVVTVFGEGESIEACRLDLDRNLAMARTRLKPWKADS